MRRMCLALLSLFVASAGFATEPLLRKNDRVALLGGTFVERMQSSGELETALQCRRPDWKLRFRNLGWSGDDVHGIARKRFDGPADGFTRLLADIDTADPTVVLVAYGFSEASDGRDAVTRFKPGLKNLVNRIGKQDRRVILLTPVAMPGYRVDRYGDWIDRCRDIVEEVGAENAVPVISIDWQPTASELTADRLLPNSKGYAALAAEMSDRLVGDSDYPETAPDALRRAIVEKNQLFFHRYRPQNETYLFLFRKHEQGNNAVEIPQFDPLIRSADQQIWKLAGSLK